MNVIDAIRDPDLFGPFLGDLETWKGWMTFLRVLHGLPVKSPKSQALIKQCTGRDYSTFDGEPFSQALVLTGRRSGKSRTAAIIGAYQAALAGHERKLSAGEQGLVAVFAPSKHQAKIVKGYIKGVFDSTPTLEQAIVRERREDFELVNGNRIQILAGDYRTARGFTLLAACVDECCFWGVVEESKVKSDTELIRAIQPSLATTDGPLIAISSPYARKGWAYQQWERNWGNPKGQTLVWWCPSRVMNPTLKQSIIDRAMEEDPASARSEYYAEFRDDIAEFLPRHVIEKCVVEGRTDLMPKKSLTYHAFVDMSGGRVDDAALAIGHRDGRKVIVDLLKRYKPPFNPQEVCADMADILRQYRCHHVTGDNYGAEWVASTFRTYSIGYTKCDKNKSVLYLEILHRLCAEAIELLDCPLLVQQFAQLERRTRSGGKDIVDHPNRPGMHDDLANAVAGLANVRPILTVGGFGESDNPRYSFNPQPIFID